MTGPVNYPPQNKENSEWTCVSWFKKISVAVASKTSPFFGRVVAAVVSVVTFIPSLAVDLVYAVKSLYDRKIAKPQTMVQNQIPGSGSQTTVQSQVPENSYQIPAPNPPLIPRAKVQWRRDIPDRDVRAIMGRYDLFLAKNITHHPKEIPKAAYQQLDKAKKGNIPIELITPDGVTTIKLQERLGGGGSKIFYDIGNGQALAMIASAHQFYDELMMLGYLEKLGIPTNEIKPAIIRWEFQDKKYTRATYIAPSFNAYAEHNAFVLDGKNYLEAASRLDDRKVLPADKDSFTLDNWDQVLMPLVKDIRTLIDNGVSTLDDACSAILVGKGTKFHSGGPADYEVRAFPFDFSSKQAEYVGLPVKERLSAKEEESTLKQYIRAVVTVQFDAYSCDLPEEWESLVVSLTKRYLRQ
ncbi:hypothetical protein [Endozoicomonas sp. ONNA2]|uniref:hypothetical protein n=1 Tax=Endozoicomonas sp. ONNA2 TaxID=2828741 RepID=UPI0021479F3A|nr:hypothetical protein [Endozoicomonas sp. ONNA2]